MQFDLAPNNSLLRELALTCRTPVYDTDLVEKDSMDLANQLNSYSKRASDP